MKIEQGVMITNEKAQLSVAKQKDSKNVMFLARNADSSEVQEAILNEHKDNKRVMVALAANYNLSPDLEMKLVELADKFPEVARVLLKRTEQL